MTKSKPAPSRKKGDTEAPFDGSKDPADDSLMAIWNRYGLKVDPFAITAIRNWSAQSAAAPKQTGIGVEVGKTMMQQSASQRIEANAAALCRSSSGLTHDQAVERIRQANPTLAAAADRETSDQEAA
jgi:hypothetical protein